MPGTSRRLGGLVQSDIRRMTREADRVGAINLGQGLGDLPTPPPVAAGAIAAIEARKATYTYPEGTGELRAAIAAKLARDNGISADPVTDIVVTVGSSGAYTCALNGLLDAGDGILLFEPYYGYHLNAAVVAGLEPQFCALPAPDFAVTEAALRAALKPNTRAVVVCTPSNPSGKMWNRAELEVLDRVARDHDLLVITDEIYEYIRYDGAAHISPATVGGLGERTVTIMGLSKTFSITGWRIGYAVAPAALARALTLVNDLYYICAPAPLQHGVTAGFTLPPDYYRQLAAEYQGKRDRLCDALARGGLPPIVPAGAYYVLADCTRLAPTALGAAMALLERARVAAIPGTAFHTGAAGERLLRFCFAKNDSELDEACRRLAALH
ncbi:MAG TPA: pyridoxal phosphate-dependent aminotransferase [Kofleriaceae bacterium]|nr:pyridoxal phosphate-dependent aminotransferase [Kofleriaceae bacterium]